MELPEGFEEPGHVCQLRRSLYGLKQAPQIWHQCVHRVLASHGFTMAQSDNCVFYKSNCVVCVYINDFLVAAANLHKVEQVQRALQTEFQLNDLGTPRSFLGIQFDYHTDGSVRSPTSVHSEGALRLWHGDLSTYANESQANFESSSRRWTYGRGSKSTFCDRHQLINVPDGRYATAYRVCATYIKSLHIPAVIATPSRSAFTT